MAEVATPPAAEPLSVSEQKIEEMAEAAEEGRFETRGRKGHRSNLKQLHGKPNAERNIQHDREQERKEILAAIAAGTKWPQASKPDDAAFQKARQKLSAEINDNMGKLGHVNAKISSVGGQKEYVRTLEELRGELETRDVQMKELQAKKKKMNDRFQKSLDEINDRKQQSKKLMRNIGFSSPDAIDGEIRNLENTAMTSTLTLKDEKAVMQKIESLRKSKVDMEIALNLAKPSSPEETQGTVSFREELNKVTADMSELWNKITALRSKRDEIMSERKIVVAPLKEFYVKKTEIGAKLSQLREQRLTLEKAHYKQLKQFRMYEQFTKMSQAEKKKEEKARIGLQQKQRSLEESLNNLELYPEENEISLLLQAAQYVKNIINERDNVAAPKPEPTTSDKCPPPPNKRLEVYHIKPQKANRKQKHQNASHSKHSSPSDLATVGTFSKFGIALPLKPTEYEKCLKILDEQEVELRKKKQKYMDTLGDRRSTLEAEIAELNALIASDDTQKIISVGLAELDKNKMRHERAFE